MAEITFKGNPVHTAGSLPAVGDAAPAFQLVGGDLSDKSLSDFSGKNVILNIVPSFDTGVCAKSVVAFNQKAGDLGDTVVVNISKDLPFAQSRFCESNQVEHVTNLSAFRSSGFGQDYGIEMVDGPLQGLLGRAVIVLDSNHQVLYTELVPEIAQEPNYEAAINSLTQTA